MPKINGSLVTEADLNGAFYPMPGHTPGTDNSQLLDCSQITARYKVSIDDVEANRMPSWDQLHDNAIPFGQMASNENTLFILDVAKQRIASVDIATMQITWLDPGIVIDSSSRILAFNNFLVVSTPNGVYFVSGTTASKELVANTASGSSSVSVMAGRVLPISSGVSSILWTRASGEAIKSWDMNNFSPNSPSNAGSSRSDMNSDTQVFTMAANINTVWANSVNFPSGIYNYEMDISASSPPYATSKGSSSISYDLICATEKYSPGAGTGTAYPYFFYSGGGNQGVLASSTGAGGNVAIDLGVNYSDCTFSIDVFPASGNSAWLYVNYDKGTGEGRIGRVRGGSTLSPAQPDWITD